MAISSKLGTDRAMISIQTYEIGLFPRGGGGILDSLSRHAPLKNHVIDWYNVNC